MPSTRLTIALNSNRNTKTVLLIPNTAPTDPAAPTSIRAQVVKTAQTKLRLKLKKTTPARIFHARTGAELLTAADWTRHTHVANDTLLLISAGEDFVGKKEDGATDASTTAAAANPDCTIASLAATAYVDALSATQLRTTATTLPGMLHAAAMPDLHPGTKFPIGAVFVAQGWVHPPLIGGDVGCGMAWYRVTGLSGAQVDGEKGRKVAERLRGLEGRWRGVREREAWVGEGSSAGERWDESLGTIGAGNHFAEVQVVERVEEGGAGVGLGEGEVVLLVHSGSRGYGGDVLKRYTAEGRVSLREGEEATARYLEEHDRACEWARANRDLIALRFLAVLEPGEEAWALGSNDVPIDEHADPVAAVQKTRRALQSRKVVDIWHNNVQRVPWPPTAPGEETSIESATASLSLSPASQQYAYIHRKGAAPTLSPDSLQPLPILPLPGSRATPTAILTPTFSPANAHGATNALSLAHGAGRAMSRAKALASLSGKYKGDAEALLQPGRVAASAAAAAAGVGREGVEKSAGTWVVCEEKQLVWEEAPEAYKDVWAVAGDLVAAGAAEVRGWCAPRISYKVRNE